MDLSTVSALLHLKAHCFKQIVKIGTYVIHCECMEAVMEKLYSSKFSCLVYLEKRILTNGHKYVSECFLPPRYSEVCVVVVCIITYVSTLKGDLFIRTYVPKDSIDICM